MFAKVRVQGMVEHVRRRMGAADGIASGGLHLGANGGVERNRSLGDVSDMEEEIVVLLRVVDPKRKSVAANQAGIADLSATLAVKRGLVEDQHDRRPAGTGGVGKPVLLEDSDHGRVGGRRFVSKEFTTLVIRFLERIERAEQVVKTGGGLGATARDPPVLGHERLVTRAIDAQILIGGEAFRSLR